MAQRQPRAGILLDGCMECSATYHDEARARDDLFNVNILPIPLSLARSGGHPSTLLDDPDCCMREFFVLTIGRVAK